MEWIKIWPYLFNVLMRDFIFEASFAALAMYHSVVFRGLD